ncbi:MAG: SoxR reducing system RseC family protein [Zoogloeaceae bacterium]|nr:SoxR reducing system RseC family protein [Zoogloeaceae bacterium]
MSAFSDSVPDAPPIMQAARVARVEEGAEEGVPAYALVEAIGGGCGRCHEAGGCGSAHLTQMFCLRPRRYRVLNPMDAPVGAQVMVVLPAGTLRRSVRLAYGLPLLALFAGAAVGDMAADDAGAAVGAVCGLILAWGWMAWRARAGNLSGEPYIATIEFQEEKT